MLLVGSSTCIRWSAIDVCLLWQPVTHNANVLLDYHDQYITVPPLPCPPLVERDKAQAAEIGYLLVDPPTCPPTHPLTHPPSQPATRHRHQH